MEKALIAAQLSAPSGLLRSSRASPGPVRSYFGNRFVYAVISQRAHGLSIGVNLNADKFCNFDCVYCEVDRRNVPVSTGIDLDVLAEELETMLGRAFGGSMRELPGYESMPEDLLRLKEVALSGDGEPTLCPMFAEVVQTVVHLRAKRTFPFFKIVLITNATGLHLTHVQEGLKLLTTRDEIWTKLDVGDEARLQQINRPKSPAAPKLQSEGGSPLNSPRVTLEYIMENILALGKQRPIVIQTLFPLLDSPELTPRDVTAYADRLNELKQRGAQISLVQIYSAHRRPARGNCGHLPLRTLSQIARRVRETTGLRTEVF